MGRLTPILAATCLFACDGLVGQPVDPLFETGEEARCADEAATPGPAPMRRLSNTEWRWTVSDLLGQDALAEGLAGDFLPETESLGFLNNGNFLDVPPVLAQQYMDAADQLSAAAVMDLGNLLSCTPAVGGEEACAVDFIGDFGARAYRRPLADDEVDAYRQLYLATAAEYDFEAGIEFVLFTMLQSPHFLYRVEFGQVDGEVARLGGYEIASRLSYLFWLSMPDATLFDAAARGELSTRDQVATQARRLLADPRARRTIRFFEEWLDLDQLTGIQRDPAVFPGFSPTVVALLQEEARAFINHVVWDVDGSFDTLMTADFTMMNDALAQHYGVPPPASSSFRRVDLNPADRGGLLTLGGVLAVHDKQSRTSIVRRGYKIRTDVLCHTIGAPPDDVPLDLLEEQSSEMSQKERLEQHRTVESCAACHQLMDPIGVAFETFDALGRLRTEDETGNVVDTATELTYTVDADGPVAGAVELTQRLAGSDEVRACFTTQMFRFALGRGETEADACSQTHLMAAFSDSGWDVRELMVALTQTDAFLFRPAIVPGG